LCCNDFSFPVRGSCFLPDEELHDVVVAWIVAIAEAALLSEQDVNRVLLSYRGEKVRTGVVQSSCGRRRRRSRRRRGASEAAWR
jgi:hypothetical protein